MAGSGTVGRRRPTSGGQPRTGEWTRDHAAGLPAVRESLHLALADDPHPSQALVDLAKAAAEHYAPNYSRTHRRRCSTNSTVRAACWSRAYGHGHRFLLAWSDCNGPTMAAGSRPRPAASRNDSHRSSGLTPRWQTTPGACASSSWIRVPRTALPPPARPDGTRGDSGARVVSVATSPPIRLADAFGSRRATGIDTGTAVRRSVCRLRRRQVATLSQCPDVPARPLPNRAEAGFGGPGGSGRLRSARNSHITKPSSVGPGRASRYGTPGKRSRLAMIQLRVAPCR